MNLGDLTERMMGMTDEIWERHANPWSVWSRVIVLPLLTVSIWSRVWIGWWAVLPVAALMIWTWINPRIFRKPKSTDNWSSKAVLGERVWLKRSTVPIPEHHDQASRILSYVPMVGLVPYVHGLIIQSPGGTTVGLVLIVIGKLWFLDRMVWLYGDMKDEQPQYSEWLY